MLTVSTASESQNINNSDSDSSEIIKFDSSSDNNSKINLKKGSNAYAHIKRAWKNGKLTNMTVPHRSWIHRGAGLAPSTVNNALMNSTESWAFINRNTGNVRAFGLGKLSSPRNLRLKVFAAFPSYGSKLLNRIKENVNRIELTSTANNLVDSDHTICYH